MILALSNNFLGWSLLHRKPDTNRGFLSLLQKGRHAEHFRRGWTLVWPPSRGLATRQAEDFKSPIRSAGALCSC